MRIARSRSWMPIRDSRMVARLGIDASACVCEGLIRWLLTLRQALEGFVEIDGREAGGGADHATRRKVDSARGALGVVLCRNEDFGHDPIRAQGMAHIFGSKVHFDPSLQG